MRSSDCPMEISLPGISLALLSSVGELQVPPHVKKKTGRAFLGWNSGRGMETAL